MLPRRAAAKIFSSNYEIARFYPLVKVLVKSFHCMCCKFCIIMNFQIRARQYYISINIVTFVFYYRALYFRSLGSVIFPVTADAAATSGDARYVCDSICPILPGKFLLVVLIQISSFANTPMCAPQHAPHVGGPTTTPASMKIFNNPPSIAFLNIDIAAGKISVLIFTVLPLRIVAAACKSSSLAPVQEPMYALSSSTEDKSRATTVFSGENGFATMGSISEPSYS